MDGHDGHAGHDGPAGHVECGDAEVESSSGLAADGHPVFDGNLVNHSEQPALVCADILRLVQEALLEGREASSLAVRFLELHQFDDFIEVLIQADDCSAFPPGRRAVVTDALLRRGLTAKVFCQRWRG